MRHAELDLSQIFVIVVFVIAGFLQWLWKLIQQGREERQRRNQEPDDSEERQLREEAWRRQVQGGGPRPAPTATPPPLHDPWSTVRDVFEKLKDEARGEPSRPAAPPPLPPPSALPPGPRPLPGTVRAELQRPQHPSPQRPLVSASLPAAQTSAVPRSAPAPSSSRPASNIGALRTLLHNPASIRQAVLLREILGPPKALQSATDAAS